MMSRRLQFLVEPLASLLAFDLYAVANSVDCVFDQIQFSSLHRCFGPAIKIPPLAEYVNSSMAGSLLKEADNPSKSTLTSSSLLVYPNVLIPPKRNGQRGVSNSLYILFKIIFLPTGPSRSSLRHSR